jgi:transcriptional regulator with XRE-family HTH domain
LLWYNVCETVSAMDSKLIIGKRIKNARLKRNFTQEALAKKTGMTQDWISSIETGRRRPELATIGDLAQALHVGIDFLCGTGNHKPKTKGKSNGKD